MERRDIPLGATSGAVGEDVATCDLAVRLELSLEPVVINVPGQRTNEEVLGDTLGESLLLNLLGLLDDRSSLGISLALLGVLDGDSLLRGGLIGRVGVGVRRVGRL